MWSDRRAGKRHPGLIKAKLTYGDQSCWATSINVSLGGGFFHVEEAPAVGSEVELAASNRDPRARAVTVRARVVRTSGAGTATGGVSGVGLLWLESPQQLFESCLRAAVRPSGTWNSPDEGEVEGVAESALASAASTEQGLEPPEPAAERLGDDAPGGVPDQDAPGDEGEEDSAPRRTVGRLSDDPWDGRPIPRFTAPPEEGDDVAESEGESAGNQGEGGENEPEATEIVAEVSQTSSQTPQELVNESEPARESTTEPAAATEFAPGSSPEPGEEPEGGASDSDAPGEQAVAEPPGLSESEPAEGGAEDEELAPEGPTEGSSIPLAVPLGRGDSPEARGSETPGGQVERDPPAVGETRSERNRAMGRGVGTSGVLRRGNTGSLTWEDSPWREEVLREYANSEAGMITTGVPVRYLLANGWHIGKVRSLIPPVDVEVVTRWSLPTPEDRICVAAMVSDETRVWTITVGGTVTDVVDSSSKRGSGGRFRLTMDPPRAAGSPEYSVESELEAAARELEQAEAQALEGGAVQVRSAESLAGTGGETAAQEGEIPLGQEGEIPLGQDGETPLGQDGEIPLGQEGID